MRLLIILPTPTAHSLSTGHVFADTHARTHAHSRLACAQAAAVCLSRLVPAQSGALPATVIGGATAAGHQLKAAPLLPAALL